MRSKRFTLFQLTVIFMIILFSGAAIAGQKQNKEDKQPSDLERGLMLFEAGLKTAKAMRPISAPEERVIGHGVARQVFLRYGPRVSDAKLNRYVKLVGEALAVKSGRRGIRYYFSIVNNQGVNAFAAPGGYIFITTGLLKKLTSEAQLAGVLAHEMAHVNKKHMLETIGRSRKLSSVLELSSIALNKDTSALSKIVNAVTDILFTRGLDQRFEYEADEVGTGYAALAGYDARGLRDFLVKLGAAKGKERSVFFQTHPATDKRIARLDRSVLTKYRGGQVHSVRYKNSFK